MAPRALSRGNARPGQLGHGYAAGARSRAGPNPCQSEVAFGRSIHARPHESREQLCEGRRLGEVMQGGGVGEVVASNHPAWRVGDTAESMSFGWQEWSVLV